MSRKLRNHILTNARTHEGYRAMADGRTTYAESTGPNPAPWNGSFLTVIFQDTTEPPFTYQWTALAHYARKNRLFRNPKIGDVAFLANGRVALVLSTDRWKRDGTVTVLEAETVNPAPRARNKSADGVWTVQRFRTDIASFGRPEYKTYKNKNIHVTDVDGQLVNENLLQTPVRLSNLQHGKVNDRVAVVQEALARVTGAREFDRGRFDMRTQSAYADWQRQCGYVPANGEPDRATLETLSARTGLFTVKD